MSDTEQPEPTPDAQPASEKRTPHFGSHLGQSILDLLPPDAKNDLHRLIIDGARSKRIKRVMEERWKHLTDIFPLDPTTYRRYLENHYEELQKAHEISADLVDGSQQSLDQLKQVADATRSGEHLSVRDQLDALVAFCQQRIDYIREQQKNRNLASAQFENVLVALVKEQRVILEKTIEYKHEVDKDIAAELDGYIMAFMEEFIGTAILIYQELHGDNLLAEFSTQIKEKLPSIREAIRREKKPETN